MRAIMKKWASLFLILTVFISFIPAFSLTAYASVESGKTGDCTWTYDSTSGIVTISGNGRMRDYEDDEDFVFPPWHPVDDPATDNSYIKKVIIEEGVTYIGQYSFVYEGITSLVIPDSVSEIGEGAFFCCSELTDVKLGKGLKRIGRRTFSQCDMKSINLPEGLEYIGRYAFCDNVNLNSVNIPDSVTSIGNCAFFGAAFTHVFIPENVTEIGERAFGFYDYQDENYDYYQKIIDGFSMTVVGNTAGEKYAIDNGIPYTVSYIAPTRISGAEISGIKNKVYTGKPITQNITVKYDGKELTEGTDYQVSYSNNTNAGTASVIITGKGEFGGNVESTFTIAKANNTLTAKAKKVTLKAKTLKKKALTVKKTKAYTVSKAKGKVTYKLAGVTKKKFKKYFKVNASNGNITVKKKLKKGTYKVTVDIIASGNSNYASKKKTVTVTVKVK